MQIKTFTVAKMSTSTLSIPESCIITFKGHSAPVNYVTFNSTGEYALSGSHDRTIKLWNPEAGLCIKTYEGHGKEVLGICVCVPYPSHWDVKSAPPAA